MRLPSLQGWTTRTVTTVRQLMGPFGRYNTNPPSLGQLREFVAACEGLDDNTSVSVEKGSLSESGTYNCSFSVRIEEELVASTVNDGPVEVIACAFCDRSLTDEWWVPMRYGSDEKVRSVCSSCLASTLTWARK
jgi:hypothetical protein